MAPFPGVHMKAEQLIEQAQSLLGGPEYRCTQKKQGKPCTQQHEDEVDRDGRPVFYFASDCKVAQTFCPACLAYWHVAVARNCLFDFARFSKEA